MINKKIEFVDVKNFGFVTEPRYYFYGWAKSPKILGRKSAVKALVKARQFLPKGHNFKIWDCHRPLKVQLAMLESIRKRIQGMHPRLSAKECEEIVLKFGGPAIERILRFDTHRNGGSFDLTIVDSRGKELWMGTDHDCLTDEAALDYYENKKRLTEFDKNAQKNRRLIKHSLTKAGFKNYAPEWWHWSFGK